MLTFFYNHPYLIGLIAFALGALFMPVVLRVAKTKHFVVRPNKRMSHTGEVPNIGGLDICFSFLLTYLIFEFNTLQQSQFLLIGVFAIMMVGFVDDILILPPLPKLLCELIAGVALISFADIRLTHLHGFLGIEVLPEVWSYVLSFFVLAAIINAFNLIDGVDGLASGLGMLYCSFFATWFYLAGDGPWCILAICLVGSLAVFFCYNVFGGTRTKIFMGDSGSLLVGYMLTAFVFRFCEQNAYHMVPEWLHMSAAPAVAISVLSIPIFDTLRVSLARIKNKKSPFQPDKNHIHHLLLNTGLNHIQTTAVLLCVSALLIGIGIVGRNWNMLLLVSVDALICAAFTLLVKLKIKN